jgi:hypothetical protein
MLGRVAWFTRRRRGTEAPKLRSRSAEVSGRRVELDDLAPSAAEFLGRAAYLQLALFENLGRVIAAAPTADAKARLAQVAQAALAKHRGLVALIERQGIAAGTAMEPFTRGIDEFQRRTTGADWPQSLMTCYLTAGFLDDFLVRLAGGLSPEVSQRALDVLDTDEQLDVIAELLEAQIAANPRTSSRLALWGRRLVGDTMLVARESLTSSLDRGRDEERIEPVFTELIAAHSRRMDRLGLTA